MTDIGEVTFTRYREPGHTRYRIRIVRADPRAYISTDMITEIRDGHCHHWATLNGDVITITDDYGQRFIYQLGDHHPEHDVFEMHWPD